MLERVIELLVKECDQEFSNDFYALSKDEQFQALCNIRPPKPASKELLEAQDEYLHVKTKQRGVVNVETLPYIDGIALWQGDITRLNADAIVNACNAQLLGCFQPLHHCIDNAIHTNAGIQVRSDCHAIMQGRELPNGEVVVTSAYNLPSAYIFHTVGPIVNQGKPTKSDQEDLGNCYTNSLETAKKMGLKTLAFCCISTGVYRYPKEAACHVAVACVRKWLRQNPGLRIIFNVFSKTDWNYYEHTLLHKD